MTDTPPINGHHYPSEPKHRGCWFSVFSVIIVVAVVTAIILIMVWLMGHVI